MVSEGGDGKFIAATVTHAVCLARKKGLGVVCTACINNIGPANKKDPCMEGSINFQIIWKFTELPLKANGLFHSCFC